MQDQVGLNEPALLVALRSGDAKAVRVWHSHYAPKLLRFARHKVAQSEVAQELVQETFINALRTLRLFRGKSSLLTWMTGILRHEIADYYRKHYAKRALKILPLSELFMAVDVPAVATTEPGVETVSRVHTVLKKMLPPQVELLWLKYVDKKQVKQIAQELGRSVKAIESELFRARIEFRRLYCQLRTE